MAGGLKGDAGGLGPWRRGPAERFPGRLLRRVRRPAPVGSARGQGQRFEGMDGVVGYVWRSVQCIWLARHLGSKS